MPNSLTESSLWFHHLVTEFRVPPVRQESRMETWITSLTSTRSAAGRKGRSSVTRSRATSVSSASSIAYSLATVCTDAGSQVSESFSRKCSGLGEEDEKCGNPSQDRDILGKRTRKVVESRVEKSSSVYPPAKKPRLEDSESQTESTNSDSPSEANEGLVWRYGGLEDESEEALDNEYRSLLLGERFDFSLTIKSGGTTTIVSPPTYKPRVERPKHQIKDTNSGLPRGVHDNDDWYKKFIPTYNKWLGTRVKPWIIDEDESIAALQVIWKAVYPHIDYVIDANCLVYRMANPRAGSWQSSFDSAAIDMFKSCYENLGLDSKETISNASRLLQNNMFMYAETTGETQKEYRGLFRSPFILELIAGHYDGISGAIRIPEFERVFSRDQRKLVNHLENRLRTLDADSREAVEIAVKLDTMRMYPVGALALCITAVERALGVFAPAGGAFFSGHRHTKIWIEKLQKYIDTIQRKLRPGSVEDIVLKACPFMDASTNISSISVQALHDSGEETSSGRSDD